MQTEQMKTNNIVEQLRNEVKTNKCLDAVCHVFAIRERARQQVTLTSLRQTMTREGYSFSFDEYEGVLKFLAKIGIGKLQKDSKGHIQALIDIKLTLQSLGLVAIDKDNQQVKKFVSRNQYHDVPTLKSSKREVPMIPPTPPPDAHNHQPPQVFGLTPELVTSVALTATINGIPAVFVIAEKMEPASLGQLLTRVYSKRPPELT